MSDSARLQDVDYMPPLREAVPLGLQHVLAMFVGNVTVPLIIAGAIGLPSACARRRGYRRVRPKG